MMAEEGNDANRQRVGGRGLDPDRATWLEAANRSVWWEEALLERILDLSRHGVLCIDLDLWNETAKEKSGGQKKNGIYRTIAGECILHHLKRIAGRL